jgi:hypothetical protein
MRFAGRVFPFLLLTFAAACDHDIPTSCCTVGDPALRIVNAFTTSVEVLVDGSIAIESLPAGSIASVAPSPGGHTLLIRATSGGRSVLVPITTAADALNTIAAVRESSGQVGAAALDDTGSVVPVGATKVRVLHLAPNAGELQVYRTQPDFQQPARWQFPFNYQSDPNTLSAPFYQSTVGSWEVRVWQSPADASGWASAPIKVVIPLSSGEKKTVLILDNPGGGVRVELI